MRWIDALKIWNSHHHSINPLHVWATPRKGTPEHAEVMKIKNGEGSTAHMKKVKLVRRPAAGETPLQKIEREGRNKDRDLNALSALQKFATGIKQRNMEARNKATNEKAMNALELHAEKIKMMNEAKKAAQITAAAPIKPEEVKRKVKLVRKKVEPKEESGQDRLTKEVNELFERALSLLREGKKDESRVIMREFDNKIALLGSEYLPYGAVQEMMDEDYIPRIQEAINEYNDKTAPKVEEPTQSTTLFPMVSRSQYRKNIELLRLAYKNLTTLKEKKPKVVDRPLYNEIKESFFNSGTINNKNLANAFMNGLVHIYNKKYGKKELEWSDWFDVRKTDQANGNNYTQTDNYRANALGKYFNIYSNDKGDDNKNVWRSNNAGYFFGFAEESKKEEPKKEEPAGVVKKQVKKIEKKIEPQVEEDDDETFDNFIESLKETEYHDYEDGVGIEVLYPTSVIVKTVKYVYEGYSFDQIIGLMRIYNYPAKELAQIINDFYEAVYIMREDGKRERKDLFEDKKYIKALQAREDDARGEA